MIYTRKGDDGTTRRADGKLCRKCDACIEAVGAVDELSAAVGLAVAQIRADDSCAGSDLATGIADTLTAVQRRLMSVGAALSGVVAPAGFPDAATVAQLERSADALNVRFAEFVLPGGSLAAAQLHVARTVCRRAERRVVAAEGLGNVGAPTAENGVQTAEFAAQTAGNGVLVPEASADGREGAAPPSAVPFLNRLSDFLFAAAEAIRQEKR